MAGRCQRIRGCLRCHPSAVSCKVLALRASIAIVPTVTLLCQTLPRPLLAGPALTPCPRLCLPPLPPFPAVASARRPALTPCRGLSSPPLRSLPDSACHPCPVPPQDLANTCYGLALLGIDEPSIWHEALLPRVAQLAPSLQPHALSNVFWSLGRLQLRPQDSVLQALVLQAKRLLVSRLTPPHGRGARGVGGVGEEEAGSASGSAELELRLLPRPQVKPQAAAESAGMQGDSGSGAERQTGGDSGGANGDTNIGAAKAAGTSASVSGVAGVYGRMSGEDCALASDGGGVPAQRVGADGGGASDASPGPSAWTASERKPRGDCHSSGGGGSGSGGSSTSSTSSGSIVAIGTTAFQVEPAMPQFVSNVTWALARLQHDDRSYFRQVERTIASITPQVRLVCAFRTRGQGQAGGRGGSGDACAMCTAQASRMLTLLSNSNTSRRLLSATHDAYPQFTRQAGKWSAAS